MADLTQDGKKRGSDGDRLSRFFAARPRLEGRVGHGGRIMRRILPLGVGLLLVAVIAWPMINRESGSITLTYSELRTGGEQIRMENARYTGTDMRDRPFAVSADLAVQEGVNADRVLLTGVHAEIEGGADDMLTVTAGEGVFRRSEDSLVLDGGINLNSDSGYMLSVERAEVDLASGVAGGQSPVSGAAPFGHFSADGFTLDSRERVLNLEGRVRVRMEPEGMKIAPAPGTDKRNGQE